jgi:acyl carrier protein
LVGYVVGDGGSEPDVDEISRFLQQLVPGPMVPATIIELDDFPRLPNGKLDRSSLPTAKRSVATEDGLGSAETPLERAIEQVWKDVLVRSSMGAEDDFFALGGSSLQAVRVLNQLEERLGVRFSAAVIFEHATVRKLAAYIGEHHPNVPIGVPVDTTGEDREEVTL